ncbi:MFS transporter, sugar porter (SP) family [Tessaracoccus bendigoensis DSM 12906]|uniref:MFS transporter, sugar porter (SP) family n=1 Tax=Tessaracoccus bendigoensis DSM 12906 TaxID=1123357 RepID=A0A1M6NKG2_9ACTN|nr:MFS transporter, sugar porter (SP) family [Tessaracoccus bendigoensis DSM 12906]
MIVIGASSAFAINAIIGNIFHADAHTWRYMMTVAVLPSIALFFGMLRMPESPRWLVLKGRESEALDVLRQVRSEERAVAEMSEVRALAEEAKMEQEGTLREVMATKWMRRLLFIGIGLSISQQLTGINSMMYYGELVLQDAGFTHEVALIVNVFNGLASVSAILIALKWIIDRFKRRTILLVGFIGTSTAHLLMGILGTQLDLGNPARPWLLLVTIVTFVFIMQATQGPLVWLMVSEIFPLKSRGAMIGVSVFMLWTTNMLVSLFFPIMQSALGFGTFFVFAGLGVLALGFIYKFVPETKGHTLEELEEHFKETLS